MDNHKIARILNFFLDTNKHIPVPNSQRFVMKLRARKAMSFVCLLFISLGMIYSVLRKTPLTFPLYTLHNGEKLQQVGSGFGQLEF